MKLLNGLCALSTVMLLCTMFAFAQTPDEVSQQSLGIRPQPGSALNGSINISSSTLVLANGIVSGSFSATSYTGNADTVNFGLVMRTPDGALVDVSPTLGMLALVENMPQAANISYSIPDSYGSSTEVFLNLANNAGISLNELRIGSTDPSTIASSCAAGFEDAVCVASSSSDFIVSIYNGGPQGALVGTTTVALEAGQSLSAVFSELLQRFNGGTFIIAGTQSSSGRVLGGFARSYTKAGPIARLVGSSLSRDANGAWNMAVYSDISETGASSTYTLSLVPTCGDAAQVPVSSAGTTEMQLILACDSGYVTITLLENGGTVDTLYQSFSVPAKDMTTQILIGLIALVVIALALVFYIMHKHHETMIPNEPIVQPIQASTMPQSPAPQPVQASPPTPPQPQTPVS